MSDADRDLKPLNDTWLSGKPQGGGSIGTDANGKVTSTSYVTDDGRRLRNPDGPAAADRIESLNEECERAWEAYRIAHDQAMSNGSELARCRNALEALFIASKFHDPDTWNGEPAMIEAAQVLGEPPFGAQS